LIVKRLLVDNLKKKLTLCGENKDKGIQDTRLNFSANNNGKTTYCWVVAIKKKGDTLKDVYQHAEAISNPRAKQCDNNISHKSENNHANIESEMDGGTEEEEEEHK
jgi:hypothetical protein